MCIAGGGTKGLEKKQSVECSTKTNPGQEKGKNIGENIRNKMVSSHPTPGLRGTAQTVGT